MNLRFGCGVPVLMLLLAACSRQAAPPSTASGELSAAAEPVATAVVDRTSPIAAQDPDAPLAVSDIDAYVTGLKREIELLEGHADALKRARAANDAAAEAGAMAALAGLQVQQAGAQAAGLQAARYAAVKGRIEQVLVQAEMALAMRPQIEAAEKADLSALAPEQKQRHEAGLAQMRAAWDAPYATLSPATAQALKARQAQLAQLRLDLAALRLGALRH